MARSPALALVPPRSSEPNGQRRNPGAGQRRGPLRIGVLVYPGFDLLDLSGPLEAFFWAEHHAPGSYELRVMSPSGGLVESSALRIETQPLVTDKLDTLIVIGGRVERAVRDESLIAYVRASSRHARRVASVCTGAFVLAEAGLLEGKSATTHWYATDRLQTAYPGVRVRGEDIYVKDGNVWSSAGISAGIDLSLALIEEDLGRDVALAIARMMVVYLRRPGGQPQRSLLLQHDAPCDAIQRVLSHAREHLQTDLSVERLAAVAHLSVRQFSRVFRSATGSSPAKTIERLRVESARPQVEAGRLTLEEIAPTVGFKDASQMRASFMRVLGVTPQALRRAVRVLE
jgi:transcriptional regulator GlxA family with amidase domain